MDERRPRVDERPPRSRIRPGWGAARGGPDRRWHVWERPAGRNVVESVANRGPQRPAGHGWELARIFGEGCALPRPGLRRAA